MRRGRHRVKDAERYQQRDADIVRRYAAGEDNLSIALDHGLSPNRVYAIALMHGLVRPRKSVSEKHIKVLQSLIAKGLSNRDISRRVGMSEPGVAYQIGRYGLREPRKPVWPPERSDELQRLRDAGLSCKEIAARLGTTPRAVTSRLWRMGLSSKRQVPHDE